MTTPYWRPNASGYTGLKSEAGRYSDAQTASCQEHDGETTWRIRYADAAECSPACPDDAKVRHLSSVIISAAEREAMLVEALREIDALAEHRRFALYSAAKNIARTALATLGATK